MKFSLRKAAVMQRNLLDEMKAIEFDTTVELNEFEDSDVVLVNKFTELNKKVQNFSNMSRQFYYIRKAVAKANQESGINDILADLANLDKHISMWEGLKAASVRVSPEVIKGKIDKMKSKEKDSYAYRGDSLTVSLVTQESMDAVLVQLANCKREKQALQDKLLHLNVATEIELMTQEEVDATDKTQDNGEIVQDVLNKASVETANEAAANYSAAAANDSDIG